MTSSTKNDLDLSQLQDQISRLAKDLKSEQDLGDLTQQLVKMSVEAALGAELEEHLGYVKHDPAGRGSGNSRNGSSAKRLKGNHGEVAIEVPRDRAGSFEPQIVRKGQTATSLMRSRASVPGCGAGALAAPEKSIFSGAAVPKLGSLRK